MPLGVTDCPSSCLGTVPNCLCASINPFNIGNQIASLFSNSALKNIGNISAILSLTFLKNALFWGIIFFTGWFLFTLLAI